MDRNIKKIGLVNLVVLLAIGVASTVVARYTNSFAGQAGVIYLGLGFLVIAIGYFQMRMEETERLERLEFEELNKTAASASLFNTADAEVFPARRSREQFERFFVPDLPSALSPASGRNLFALELAHQSDSIAAGPADGWDVFVRLVCSDHLSPGQVPVGLTRLEGARLLRPGASYLLLGAYVCFVVTICIAAVGWAF